MGKFIIVGGGPVGCLAALQLAHQGHTVTVYEGRSYIPTDPSESYPIGVNPRGLHAIESVAPQVAQRIRSEGHVVDAWEIYAGRRRVAKLESGVVYGTSRGNVNLHLWEACQGHPNIEAHMRHKLKSMDFTAKSLTFEVVFPDTSPSEVIVDASEARVVGADGVHSTVRASMQRADPSFSAKVTPWANEYRVLFGAVGQLTAELDPAVHYIFSGGYTATIDNGGTKQWTLVTTVRDSDPDDSVSQLVRETDASADNVAKLKAWIQSIAPQFLQLLPPGELERYFARRTYRGAVVECTKFDVHEWVVLLGDAAHSVLPPTGEGINSGLEDTLVLASCTGGTCDAPFAAYTKARLPDISSILVYANHLNASPSFAGERVARLVFMLAESSSNESIGQSLFGPLGIHHWPYKAIVDKWARRRLFWLNAARLVTYPLSAIAWVVMLPLQVCRPNAKKGARTVVIQGVV
ncbi:hypothetical protein H310_01809 [Aphanomyces invadans]|uniref:FAD-binding domain-containing protein n=1 Tax=Aphanomyces invadans TaxID=157072 RepID=A0A024UM29_9STRA|nr:hypothetical protein H310_01809 [Aphanomyces invadans]ETW07245.1 hypothetical protein H310_01809 [Aphanomyces invadans]RHY24622.1 hypothetical protein DYB32_008774 [Aphanomyces invadans]|eukprot:XP_008863338.1 hypothetical protein H310_01809 [Aphanomyces invadans]